MGVEKRLSLAVTGVRIPDRLARSDLLYGVSYPNTTLIFNPLNAKLNPICHLLAVLGAHPIFHVSRIRVKLVDSTCVLTVRMQRS